MKKMTGIQKRWFFNTVSVMFALVCAAVVIVSLAISY